MGTNSLLVVDCVSTRFGSVEVIRSLSLEVEAGSITVLLAPSGAGKTTLLRMICGFEQPTSGEIRVAGKKVDSPHHHIGMVFQQSSVFPWMSVEENIRFGIRTKSWRTSGKQPPGIESLEKSVGLDGLMDRRASDLSGGQAQRVEIARALATKPNILLLDEPFSSLDERTRDVMRLLLLRLHAEHAPTIFLVTHNLDDALFLGDRLLIGDGPPLNFEREINVRFTAPRTLSLLDSAEFASQRARLRALDRASS